MVTSTAIYCVQIPLSLFHLLGINYAILVDHASNISDCCQDASGLKPALMVI